MSQSRKLIIWLAAAALFATVLFFLIYINIVHSVDTSAVGDQTEEAVTVDSEQFDTSGMKNKGSGNSNEELNNNRPEMEVEEIVGVTAERPYCKKLVEDGSKNILVVGEDKENYLYDTIMIISVSKKHDKIKIIQIPRDTYIKYNKKVITFLESRGILDEPGIFKINYSHNIGIMMKYKGRFAPFTSMSFLADVIEEKFAIRVDDFVKVNTKSFIEVVDLFGGVDIYVPYDMNYDDPTQDLHIHLKKGEQHLNGVQAEGFVRFRKGYDEEGNIVEYGDIERKKNQIAFIKAFIKQHGTIANIDKIPEVIKTLNLKHSIGFGDVLFTYMGIARDVIANNYEIESMILTGKPKIIRGSSYIVIDCEG